MLQRCKKYQKDDFKEIIELMEKDAGEKMDVWIDFSRLFIKGEESELMLRIQQPAKTITIAVISFKETRRGNGTSLLKLLKEFSKKEEFNKILVESSLTSEMNAFCIKNGFTPVENTGMYRDGIFFGNWKLTV